MKVSEVTRTAFRSLEKNWTRAALTALGIVIGVAAVIAMMEIGKGSASAIQRTIASMGSNNLIIMPGTAASSGVSFGQGSALTLTPLDVQALAKYSSTISAAAPIVRAKGQVVYGDQNWVPQFIYGTTPSFLDVRDWHDIAEGEMFGEKDIRNLSKVCVIGQTILRQLFLGRPAVGENIRIQNVPFKVIGVLSKKGANMMGMDQDDLILAPWTTIKFRLSNTSSTQSTAQTQSTSTDQSNQQNNTLSDFYPSSQNSLYPDVSTIQQQDTPLPIRFTNIDQIVASAKSSENIQDAIKDISQILRTQHRLRPSDPDDFSIRDMTEVTQVLASTTKMISKLLLSVALISLIVGGVGIMNIMLVSVTERTREIGLRMAVGARMKDILAQFLIEAVILCLFGGFAGILLGELASFLIAYFLKWPVESSLWAITTAFLVSASVGIVFGFYPAYKASKLDPIEALRYE